MILTGCERALAMTDFVASDASLYSSLVVPRARRSLVRPAISTAANEESEDGAESRNEDRDCSSEMNCVDAGVSGSTPKRSRRRAGAEGDEEASAE